MAFELESGHKIAGLERGICVTRTKVGTGTVTLFWLISADGDGVLKVWKLSNAREMASHQMPTDGDFPFVMPQV